ncbi:molybdopterin-binding oxidoreductase [Caulobacter mirabilis]|nr:molybdopterin-binding oxidoreductase [Caulobacter mirabilis]
MTALSLGLALLASPALAQSITVKGPAGTVTLDAAALAALPRQTVTLDAHGTKHDYSGPLLMDVLAKAGAPTGKALRGPELANVVLVTAADGYQVVFGLAEADPNTRANRMILADRDETGPLDAKTGPLRLVVEGDLRPARSARQVIQLEVLLIGRPPPAAASAEHKH